MTPIRVVVADDHALLREGVRKILSMEPDIIVVGEAADAEGAVEAARGLAPDVVLMDVNMPGSGPEAIRSIHEVNPRIEVIALTVQDDPDSVAQWVEGGVRGYILKDVDPAALADAIRRARRGEMVIPGSLVQGLARRLHGGNGEQSFQPPEGCEALTARELEILQLIVDGKSNREIGKSLFISEKTVKNHITNMLRKLNLSDRTQAAVFAIRHGLAK